MKGGEVIRIAVAGTGYVGLPLLCSSCAVYEVCALDIVFERVDVLQSPIQDAEIERFPNETEADNCELDMYATADAAIVCAGADYAIVATPTDYDSERNFFDISSVEAAMSIIRSVSSAV